MRCRISRERFCNTLDWIIVPILGFISIFFVTEVWQNYILEVTNISTEEVPIQEHPSITLSFGHPLSVNRMFFEPDQFTIYYYKVNKTSSSFSFIKLYEGDNEFDEEIIHLKRMQSVYSISAIPKNGETFIDNTKDESRLIKLKFPSEWIHDVPFWRNSLYVYLSTEDDSYGVERYKFIDGKPLEFIVRPQTYGGVDLRPKMTKVLKEKSGCREESFYKLFQYEFVEEAKILCGEVNACRPTELPNNPIRRCNTTDEYICARKAMGISLRNSKHHKTAPCTKIEYDESTPSGLFALSMIRKRSLTVSQSSTAT